MNPRCLAVVVFLVGPAGAANAQRWDSWGARPPRASDSDAAPDRRRPDPGTQSWGAPAGRAVGPGPGSTTEVDSAGNYRHYDSRRQSLGSSTPSSNGTTTTHYDAVGRRVGSSERSSNGTVTHYDAGGRRSGTSERSSDGATTYQYDAAGRIAGSSRVLSNGQTVYYDAAGRMITR